MLIAMSSTALESSAKMPGQGKGLTYALIELAIKGPWLRAGEVGRLIFLFNQVHDALGVYMKTKTQDSHHQTTIPKTQ